MDNFKQHFRFTPCLSPVCSKTSEERLIKLRILPSKTVVALQEKGKEKSNKKGE